MLQIDEPNFDDINFYRLTYIRIKFKIKKMIESFDDDVYEDFISCWLLGHVSKIYADVERVYRY